MLAVAGEDDVGRAARLEADAVVFVCQFQQVYRLVDRLVQGEGLALLQVAAAATEALERAEDVGDTPCLLDDVLDALAHHLGVFFVAQVLRQRRNAGDRVADLVCNTGGQAADRGQAVVVRQLGLEIAEIGEVFDQHHHAGPRRAGAFDHRIGIGRLVQVVPAWLAGHRQLHAVDVVLVGAREPAEQAVPGPRQLVELGSDQRRRLDPGHHLECQVPQHDLALVVGRADAERQVLQDLPVQAAQVVQLDAQTLQLRARGLQAVFDMAQRIGQSGLRLRIEFEAAVDDDVRELRPEQAGQVAFDAFAQAAQFGGTALVGAHRQVAQGLVDLTVGHRLTQRAGQQGAELRRRAGDHDTGKRRRRLGAARTRGLAFARRLAGQQGDQYEQAAVDGQTDESGKRPLVHATGGDQLRDSHVSDQDAGGVQQRRQQQY